MFLAKNEATNGTGAAVRCLEAANGTQRGMKDVMRRVRFATAALALIAAPAGAADIPRQGARLPYAAPAPAVTFTWTGPYLGVNLGHQWSSLSPLVGEPSGISGGIQGGYNWQFGQLVVGGEADIQASAAEDTFAAYKFSNPWFGTARGRLGYAMSNVLLYATAGLGYGRGRLVIAGLSEDQTHVGWTGGGGIEVGLASNWSAKAEYLFISLSDKTYVLSGATTGIDSHLVRFGVNYRF
jgi:outer membrane immunogenic protein